MNSNMMITLVWLGAFTMVVLTVYFIMKFKSVRPPDVLEVAMPPKRKSDWQKPGIVVLGIGFGILMTGILHTNTIIDNDAINVGIVTICAGVAMVIANVLDKDKSTED